MQSPHDLFGIHQFFLNPGQIGVIGRTGKSQCLDAFRTYGIKLKRINDKPNNLVRRYFKYFRWNRYFRNQRKVGCLIGLISQIHGKWGLGCTGNPYQHHIGLFETGWVLSIIIFYSEFNGCHTLEIFLIQTVDNARFHTWTAVSHIGHHVQHRPQNIHILHMFFSGNLFKALPKFLGYQGMTYDTAIGSCFFNDIANLFRMSDKRNTHNIHGILIKLADCRLCHFFGSFSDGVRNYIQRFGLAHNYLPLPFPSLRNKRVMLVLDKRPQSAYFFTPLSSSIVTTGRQSISKSMSF